MLVTKPLTKKQVKENLNSEGQLCVDIVVSLEQLFEGIEAVNDGMDTNILKRGTLSCISYQIVGSIPPPQGTYIGGDVILRVTADVEDDI